MSARHCSCGELLLRLTSQTPLGTLQHGTDMPGANREQSHSLTSGLSVSEGLLSPQHCHVLCVMCHTACMGLFTWLRLKVC